MVRKPSNKWRMCIDYRDLNNACLKDPYLLPSIDALMDGALGYGLLNFMDAYSGYNQIQMHPCDEFNTAFMMDEGNFCYKGMPFGLKNEGATYKRLIDHIFKEHIEVYVDDMVVKSETEVGHADSLPSIFGVLRKHQLKLNPKKCLFGVRADKFLGFMLTQRGIEANPKKCNAIINMGSPRSVKEVQQLAKRNMTLSRFLSRLAEKSASIFQYLRKIERFKWTDDCKAAFQELKVMLAAPPIITRSIIGKPMYVYMYVSNNVVSSIIIQEGEGEQKLIYYVSKALQGAKQRYQKIKKVALAIITTTRKLRSYFQSHLVVCRTDLLI
ncbi:Retrovirus-related Pol polyprotein from transposon opus, partial [Mucuna pruriens]